MKLKTTWIPDRDNFAKEYAPGYYDPGNGCTSYIYVTYALYPTGRQIYVPESFLTLLSYFSEKD